MVNWLEKMLYEEAGKRHEMMRIKATELNILALTNGKENFYAKWINDVVVSLQLNHIIW